MASEPLKILYRNHRGEVAVRTISPRDCQYGSTYWHAEQTWFLKARDIDKNAIRDFVICDILATGDAAIAAYLKMERVYKEEVKAARQLAREEDSRDG